MKLDTGFWNDKGEFIEDDYKTCLEEIRELITKHCFDEDLKKCMNIILRKINEVLGE